MTATEYNISLAHYSMNLLYKLYIHLYYIKGAFLEFLLTILKAIVSYSSVKHLWFGHYCNVFFILSKMIIQFIEKIALYLMKQFLPLTASEV